MNTVVRNALPLPLAPQSSLKAALDHEIAHHCDRKVTKRLALKLALAVIGEDRDGMFLAEKLVEELRPRIKHEAALREIYLEREVTNVR